MKINKEELYKLYMKWVGWESFNEKAEEFHKKRQEVAEKFLNENTITYDEWVAKHKTGWVQVF